MPMPSWSLPVDCLELFSFNPGAEMPDSANIDASPGTLIVVGEDGAGGASVGAIDDVLFLGGMVSIVSRLICEQHLRLDSPACYRAVNIALDRKSRLRGQPKIQSCMLFFTEGNVAISVLQPRSRLFDLEFHSLCSATAREEAHRLRRTAGE